jgi:hypothetical protein
MEVVAARRPATTTEKRSAPTDGDARAARTASTTGTGVTFVLSWLEAPLRERLMAPLARPSRAESCEVAGAARRGAGGERRGRGERLMRAMPGPGSPTPSCDARSGWSLPDAARPPSQRKRVLRFGTQAAASRRLVADEP